MDPFKPRPPRPRSSPPRLIEVDAESIAFKAIAYIAGDEELSGRFAASSGCGIDSFRERRADRGFLGAVLDFMLGDERCVVAFARHEGIAPETVMLARNRLP